MIGVIGGFFLLGKPFDPVVWWLIVVLLAGIGDVATTWVATKREGVEEANPFLRDILGDTPSLPGLVISHVLGFGVVFLGYVIVAHTEYAIVIPVGLAGMGGYAVLNNLFQIRNSNP